MLSDKKLNKIEKALGKDKMAELEGLSAEELKSAIVAAESSVKQATDELERNQEFQALKESIKAMSEGLREVKKRQSNITQYSLHLLEEKGQDSSVENQVKSLTKGIP